MDKIKSKFCIKGIYASGMVLQQNTINCIFGNCDENSVVQMHFRGENYYSQKDEASSEWKIEYNPGEAGGPFEMEIICQNEKILFENVFVGEVWLCSGQSNAQLPMERLKYSYTEEFLLPENPNIRIITIPISYSFGAEKDTIENPEWKCANFQNLGGMSGTSYFFAKEMQQKLGVPIGIINASQGGSPISSWMNEESLKNCVYSKDYSERIKKWKSKTAVKNKKEEVLKNQNKWDSRLIDLDKGLKIQLEKVSFDECEVVTGEKWNETSIPCDFPFLGKQGGVVWFKKELILTAEQADFLNKDSTNAMLWFGTIQDADKIWINGTFCGVTYYTYPPRRYKIPAGIFVEGKNTITLRIQKNGEGPIRFYDEKPYYLFADEADSGEIPNLLVKKHPSVVAFRNVECQNFTEPSLKFDLSGKWKFWISCKTEVRPGEMFFEWEPTALYNAMLAPCFTHSIAGALWYQGESNAGEFENYQELLVKMIKLWRNSFCFAKNKNFPFVVMGLPNWADGYKDEKLQNFGDWAQMRQAQFKAVEECEASGFVSMIDAREWNDLHPEKKRTGGTRAAKEALRIAYGFDKSHNYNPAPKVEYCEFKGKIFTVRFNCGKSELKAFDVINKDKKGQEKTDFSKETTEVYGFEFIDNMGNSIPAKAKLISKTDVEIYVPEVADDWKNFKTPSTDHLKTDSLVELRFLWKNNPWIVNLYSIEEIPPIPFKILL